MSRTEFTAEEFEALGEGDGALWPRFFLFPALATLGYVGFVMGLGGDSITARLLWSVSLGYCWFCVAGSFHEAVHQTMGRSRGANIWFGRVVGTLLVIPYSCYRETHIRHHAYLNTTDDFELWPYSSPRRSLAFRRAFVIFDLLGAVVANPVVYGRIYFSKRSPLSAAARRTIFREYMGIIAFWGTTAALLTAFTVTGHLDWSRFDPMWLLPMPIAAACNGFRKFTEHLGMASTDPILGTRTIIGNNWITRICSYFNFELFVHGPHHRFPKSPHFELEGKLAEYRRKNPDAVVPLFPSYFAAAMDTLPHLWRNPAVGAAAGGKNEYHVSKGVENFVSEVGAKADDQQRAA